MICGASDDVLGAGREEGGSLSVHVRVRGAAWPRPPQQSAAPRGRPEALSNDSASFFPVDFEEASLEHTLASVCASGTAPRCRGRYPRCLSAFCSAVLLAIRSSTNCWLAGGAALGPTAPQREDAGLPLTSPFYCKLCGPEIWGQLALASSGIGGIGGGSGGGGAMHGPQRGLAAGC